jgi:predicted metal-dependent phosphoesterase TrpH
MLGGTTLGIEEGARADLHMHSKYSPDSGLDPREMAKLAKAKGLRVLSLTDHNSIDGHRAMREACKDEGILFIPGVEITSREGHILCYGSGGLVGTGLSAAETVEAIHVMGGIASAAHPERVYTGLSVEAVRGAKFDAVEAFNSQSAAAHNAQARKVADELRLPVTGGSDAHQGYRISMGYLAMEQEPSSLDEALDLILKGKNQAGGHRPSFSMVLRRSVGTAAHWVLRGGRKI